ncbi:MAG TPA: DUF1015 family protein [bacterium]|nr:DUF1015 family protein [bacterium]
MVTVRPFKAFRPPQSLVEEMAALPYDVINTDEAAELAKGKPRSFFHITRAEIDLPREMDIHDDKVYAQGRAALDRFIKEGALVQDKEPLFYIYAQKMGDHVQTGIVGCVSADEYNADLIKKHELTRKDKEDDRTRHVVTQNANAEPVFLTYRARKELDTLVFGYTGKNAPEYDFIADDGIRHTLWVVRDAALNQKITASFKGIDALYVADGHHRSASAARAQVEKRKHDQHPSPDKEYNFFLAVIFPHDQLRIMDYNRLVKDLHGNTSEQFIKKISEKFTVTAGTQAAPAAMHAFGMYLDGKWHQITAKPGSFDPKDPINSLDVAILQNNLLGPILGITDPRTDKRIDFVGGIRGLKELEKRVNSGEMKVAFSMYPTTLDQLINVADAGKIMPPKSTWFEPKLRSGLFVHLLD